MATFAGTFTELEKFIGPRLRNIVQTSIAPQYKKKIGKCESCNTEKNLEAAHLHFCERKVIMKRAYVDYAIDDKIVNMDLEVFEQKFKDLHYPLEKTFKILCKKCHKEYDNKYSTNRQKSIKNDKLLSCHI